LAKYADPTVYKYKGSDPKQRNAAMEEYGLVVDLEGAVQVALDEATLADTAATQQHYLNVHGSH